MILVAIHSICWLALKPVTPNSDDLCYLNETHKIINGTYDVTSSLKSHRFLVFIPVLILNYVFGYSPFIISLYPLICSLITILITFYILSRYFNLKLSFFITLLLSINLIQIIFSTVLFPDIIVSFFASLLLVILYLYRNTLNFIFPIISVFVFFLGFFAKEIIILMLPFIIYLCIDDIKRKNNMRFWQRFWILFMIFVSIVLLSFYLLLGDYKFIYTIMDKTHNLNYVPDYNFTEFIKRITYEPIVWFNYQLGYIFLLIFSIPSIVRTSRRKFKIIDFESFIAVYFLSLLLLFWFGTTSLTRFAPILLIDRMLMMLIFPMVILTGFTFNKLINKEMLNKEFYLLITILTGFAIFNLFEVSITRCLLFLCFCSSLIIVKFLNKIKGQFLELKLFVLIIPNLVLTINFLISNNNW